MVCMKCGRTLRDDAVVCKGCGAQQYHINPPKREKIKNLMPMAVKVGGKEITVRQLCISLLCAVVLLAVSTAVIPGIMSAVANAVKNEHHTGIIKEDDNSDDLLDKVSGEIIVLDSQIADCVVASEKAHADGTWEKEFLVNGAIKVKTLRNKSSEDWINSHIFPLYPDVAQVVPVDNVPSFTDCVSTRIRISETTYAPNCVVEAVIVKTSAFDHLFIVEMPTELFENKEYQVWLDEWVESLKIVDAASYNDGSRAEV